MTEHELQKIILSDLKALGVFHYRQNTGRRGGVSYGKKGAPDIVAVVNGKYIGIEVKRPDGKQSEDQRQFQADLEAAGGSYYIVDSLGQWERIIRLTYLAKS